MQLVSTGGSQQQLGEGQGPSVSVEWQKNMNKVEINREIIIQKIYKLEELSMINDFRWLCLRVMTNCLF